MTSPAYHGPVNPPTVRDGDRSPALAEFLRRYDEDDNEWWRLPSGDQKNLFDEAIDELHYCQRKIIELGRDRTVELGRIDDSDC